MKITVGCRKECGACCIAPSISSSLPGYPNGKPAGVRCPSLSQAFLCIVYGTAEQPEVCRSLKPTKEMCGETREEAMENLAKLEELTKF